MSIQELLALTPAERMALPVGQMLAPFVPNVHLPAPDPDRKFVQECRLCDGRRFYGRTKAISRDKYQAHRTTHHIEETP